MSYTIRIRGENDSFTVGDVEGLAIANAHTKYKTNKQDTFLRFDFKQFSASDIKTIDINRSEIVQDGSRETELRELSNEERQILRLPPEERARYFSRRYYIFFHHARTGVRPTENEMQKAVETLTPWFQANPKRMIPDPQVMFELAPIGKPSVLHSSLYGYYEGALDRDYKQFAWRK